MKHYVIIAVNSTKVYNLFDWDFITIDISGWFGFRRIFTLLAFLGFANVYAMRVNLSVGIVAMVNSSAIEPPSHNFSDTCPVPSTNSSHHDRVSNFNKFYFRFVFYEFSNGYYYWILLFLWLDMSCYILYVW